MVQRIKLLLTLWTSGMVAGIVVCLLRLFGRVKVKDIGLYKIMHLWHLMKEKKGILLICNHPSMAETLVVPTLFFPFYLFFGRFIPISTPDVHFYKSWWFALFRLVCIPISRGEEEASSSALKKMIKILKSGGIIVLFAEGTRTCNVPEEKLLYSKDKKRKIGPFKGGVGLLFKFASVVPIWAEGGEKIMPNLKYEGRKRHLPFPRFWRSMTIRFGDIINPANIDSGNITGALENILLELDGEK